MAHSNAPWKMERPQDQGISDADYAWMIFGGRYGDLLATVGPLVRRGARGTAEVEDNARIMTAAPELLNALESLINDAAFDPVHKTWTIGPFSDDPKGRIAYSQAAIAKARKGTGQ